MPTPQRGNSRTTAVILIISQETAQLEAQAFELEQRTQFASEAKTVLDSWVRYEAQVKQRQQKELAETLIAKVKKELENPKVLNQILQQSIADVESMLQFTSVLVTPYLTRFSTRDRFLQGTVNRQKRVWDRLWFSFVALGNSMQYISFLLLKNEFSSRAIQKNQRVSGKKYTRGQE